MRKKILSILICTLVITTVCLPMAGSATISSKNSSTDPNYGALNFLDKSAYSKIGNNLDNWGITESIDLTEYDAAMLIFSQMYNIIPPGGTDKGYVKISDNGGSSWTTLEEIEGQTGLEWEKIHIDLHQWAGKTVLIGFEFKTGPKSISYGWYVDRILIETETGFIFKEDFEEYDNGDAWGDWVVTIKSSINQKPTPPIITGPDKGNTNTLYEFSFQSFDPELDNISYYIKWGDGNTTDWSEPQASGSISYIEKHQWSEEGTYTIIAKARDTHNFESEWSDEFEVKIQRGRGRQSTNSLFLQLLERLLEQLHSLFPILNKVIGSLVTI